MSQLAADFRPLTALIPVMQGQSMSGVTPASGRSRAARLPALSGRGRAARLPALRRPGPARRALVALELVTGVAGLAGGVPLAAAPDGSLLRADPATLVGTPFTDWRVPGVLLAGLVGGGFLLAGWWQWRGRRTGYHLPGRGGGR